MELLSSEALPSRIENEWVFLEMPERLESHRQGVFREQVARFMSEGRTRLVIDFSRARFISLPSIKFLTEAGEQLKSMGGTLAIMAASEKIKRQFDVYGSLGQLKVVRRPSELDGTN